MYLRSQNREDTTQGRLFKWNTVGLGSVFSFPGIGSRNKFKKPSLLFYLPKNISSNANFKKPHSLFKIRSPTTCHYTVNLTSCASNDK